VNKTEHTKLELIGYEILDYILTLNKDRKKNGEPIIIFAQEERFCIASQIEIKVKELLEGCTELVVPAETLVIANQPQNNYNGVAVNLPTKIIGDIKVKNIKNVIKDLQEVAEHFEGRGLDTLQNMTEEAIMFLGQIEPQVIKAVPQAVLLAEDGSSYCNKCNTKLMLLQCVGNAEPDAEPYKFGEEIKIDEDIDLGHFIIRWCNKCEKIKELVE
jgi:hypothetical protein